MIKSGKDVQMPILTTLFNLILVNQVFPEGWRVNSITPIHKKGNALNPENYRGIAVSSHLSKLLCSILNNRLMDFTEKHKTIPFNQIGFKRNCRTSDHIFTLKTIIDKYINQLPRQYLFSCFVDFFKSAFDTVWRQGLFYKLTACGIGGNFLGLLQNMYTNVSYSIKTEHGCTEKFSSNVGVKQGCVLSPILFNLFTFLIYLMLLAARCNWTHAI